ncbi:MAG: NUDIX domain-containing protein [Trueperaceae bacterium]
MTGVAGATAAPAPEVRATVRALVLDADERLLLQAYLDPTVHRPGGLPHRAPVWIAPGGGLAPGEGAEAGLERELREETGLVGVAWGPWLWRRTVDLHYQGRVRRFVEHYRLGRLPAAAPRAAPTALDAHERGVLLDHRWWPLPELLATTATVYPPRLAERLAAVLAGADTREVVDISHEG